MWVIQQIHLKKTNVSHFWFGIWKAEDLCSCSTWSLAQHGPRPVVSHFIIEVCLCNCDDNESQRHPENVSSSDQLETSPETEDLNSKSKFIQLSAKMLLEASTKELQECRNASVLWPFWNSGLCHPVFGELDFWFIIHNILSLTLNRIHAHSELLDQKERQLELSKSFCFKRIVSLSL